MNGHVTGQISFPGTIYATFHFPQSLYFPSKTPDFLLKYSSNLVCAPLMPS